MRKSLKDITLVCILSLCLTVPCLAASSKAEFKAKIAEDNEGTPVKLYTAYNLFTERGKVRAINFRVGEIIPAGTPVEVTLTVRKYPPYGPTINFITLNDRKNYWIDFTQRYHPGKSVYDYANLMFSKRTFEEVTSGKNTDVINAIRRSAVIEGMTKEEVILSYGYPPEHVTYSLLKNKWVYWKNRRTKKTICFGKEERATSCEKMEKEEPDDL